MMAFMITPLHKREAKCFPALRFPLAIATEDVFACPYITLMILFLPAFAFLGYALLATGAA